MKVFCSVLVVSCALLTLPSFAEDDAKLQKDLAKVRERIAEAQNKANAENTRYIRVKDRIVYDNEAIKGIYQEMKEAEKIFHEKRQKVDDEIMKLPEIREILKSRNDAYTALRKLKDEEILVLKEMKAVKPKKKEETSAEKK